MKTPYFYIIKHKESGKRYVGSKWAKDADTETFMTDDGYKTSSVTVHELIEKDGLYSFEIEDIITEEEILIPDGIAGTAILPTRLEKFASKTERSGSNLVGIGTDETARSLA